MNHDAYALSVRPLETPPFRLGRFLVQPPLNRILDGETVHQLEPRIMHVLVCLASRPGKVVPREALLRAVWGETIIAEEGLTVAVSELRRIFGDSPREPSFIETIRKGGYRLIATPEPLEEPGGVEASGVRPGSPDPERSAAPGPEAQAVQRARGPRVPWFWLAVGAVVVLVAFWLTRPGTSAPPRDPVVRGTLLTSYPGAELHPALSPDGTQIAFARRGENDPSLDIYVKQPNRERALRLTEDPAPEFFPTWSPDGSTLAFVRHEAGSRSICTVPSIGGPVRRLIEIAGDVAGIDWSPDGEWIAYSGPTAEDEYIQVILLSVETLETEALTSETAQFTCAVDPAFSPDGAWVAFNRSSSLFQQDVYVMPRGGGEARRLTHGMRQIRGLAWTPDGESIVFSAAPVGDFGLWRVSLETGLTSWIPTSRNEALRPSIARHANRLVYSDVVSNRDIWGCRLQKRLRQTDPPAARIASTRRDFEAAFAPDGSRIAFVSQRSGCREIWAARRDGSEAQQLTHLGGTYVTMPCWSPDGARIAFTAVPDDYAEIHWVEIASGRLTRLPADDHHEILWCWSPDGEWLYFESDAGEGFQIWRSHPDGSGAEMVAARGHSPLWACRDGGSVIGCQHDAYGLWRHPIAGGPPEELVPGDVMSTWYGLAPVDDGVYFCRPRAQDNLLCFYTYATTAIDTLGTVPNYAGSNLAISPAEDEALFDHATASESDLILVADFK